MRLPPDRPSDGIDEVAVATGPSERPNRMRMTAAAGERVDGGHRGFWRRARSRRSQRCSGDVAAVEGSRTALEGDFVPPRPPTGPIPLPRGSGHCAFAVARRRSGTTSDRAMRRRCRARRTRTPTRTERGVRTTRGCPAAPRRRVRRRRRLRSCCCDDGAKCRSTSNSIRTSSPATGRSWPSASASVVFSTSTTRRSTSWRTVGSESIARLHPSHDYDCNAIKREKKCRITLFFSSCTMILTQS